ncbi:MAG TPA: hypothetical protein VLT60_00675 [Usitatibacter sp.]|nr:hypothetical protein [Usitatibacter sp.]HUL55477.1 hypothetical protein [Usitatibacter sp.]
MTQRDQFVEDLKSRLDRWNAHAAQWEEHARKSRDEYLVKYNERRDQALYQLKLLEKASEAAYGDVAKGADQAWKALSEAYEKAVEHFEKSPAKKHR